jgi:hypothetical protein
MSGRNPKKKYDAAIPIRICHLHGQITSFLYFFGHVHSISVEGGPNLATDRPFIPRVVIIKTGVGNRAARAWKYPGISSMVSGVDD